jgi:hypothetical protein
MIKLTYVIVCEKQHNTLNNSTLQRIYNNL